jgi:hypothetical protein
MSGTQKKQPSLKKTNQKIHFPFANFAGLFSNKDYDIVIWRNV